MLRQLAKSENICERRVAIVSTLALIKIRDVRTTFRVARMLLSDRHDLIHKAVGWALREAGKVDTPALCAFLREHYDALPRTALRTVVSSRKPAVEETLSG